MVRYSTWLPSSCQTQRTNKVIRKYQIQRRHCGSSLSTLAGFLIGSVIRGSRFMFRCLFRSVDGQTLNRKQGNPDIRTCPCPIARKFQYDRRRRLENRQNADGGMPPTWDDAPAAYGFGRPESLKPKRPLPLMISATFSGTMFSQPGSPRWIFASTSREKISITDGSLPLIGT